MPRLVHVTLALLAWPATWALAWSEADTARWVADQGGRSAQDAAGHIVSVDLASTWITDADLARVAGLPQLHRLDLSHTRISDVGMEYLKSLPAVSELNLYFAEFITDDSIASLKTWSRLERLDLRGTRVTSRVFEYLGHLTGLKSLDLSHTQIDDEGFEELAALTRLEDLAIGANRLSGACLSLLKGLPSLRRLDVGGIQRVDSGLWGIALTDDNLQRLADLTQLEALSLAGANLSDRGIDRPGQPEAIRTELRDLSKLVKLVNLRTLDISGTPVSDDALRPLASLPNLRELRVGLARNLHDAAVPNLLAMKQLRFLYIAGTGITATGAAQLRQSGRIEKLVTGDL
jgi:Leucine-rich repeat (LRR) protein